MLGPERTPYVSAVRHSLGLMPFFLLKIGWYPGYKHHVLLLAVR